MNETRSAEFSQCRRYRYTLLIVWDDALPLMQVIGLNPSTADEVVDDPTVRRCKGFARREGCGGLMMTNLFAFRATDPDVMKAQVLPIGELISQKPNCTMGILDQINDQHLTHAASGCRIVVAAWGIHGVHLGRAEQVKDLIPGMKCFGLTREGHPKHPLYLAKITPLIPYS